MISNYNHKTSIKWSDSPHLKTPSRNQVGLWSECIPRASNSTPPAAPCPSSSQQPHRPRVSKSGCPWRHQNFTIFVLKRTHGPLGICHFKKPPIGTLIYNEIYIYTHRWNLLHMSDMPQSHNSTGNPNIEIVSCKLSLDQSDPLIIFSAWVPILAG